MFPTLRLLALAHAALLAGSAAAPATLAAREPAQIVSLLCAGCHGQNLTGANGPNLLDAFWNHGGDRESIIRTIQLGYPLSGMPPFKRIVSDAEVGALADYILAQGKEFAAGRITLPPPPADMTIQSEKQTFRLETVVPNIDTPWGFDFLPGGALIFTEKPGRLRIVENGRLKPAAIAGTPKVFFRQDGGMLDVIAHPDYARNGWLYLAYSEEGRVPDTSMTVVVRGRIRDGRWVDQQELFRASPDRYWGGYIHYGCRFYFDDQRHLFFTLGDRGHPHDAQDLASPLGKIHRVNDDGTIPRDNPFVNTPGAVASIWSYGHRHPQGLVSHPVTGKLWEAEHGPTGGDELNIIQPGHNYGWPVISDGTDYQIEIQGPTHEGMESPITSWTPAIAPSAIAFYAGDRYPPWKNNLFVTSLVGEHLRRLELDGDRVVHQEVLFRRMGRVRDVMTGPDGLLYVAFNSPGRIVRLVPVADDAPAASHAAMTAAKP